MTDARKAEFAECGFEVLAALHPRDLVRRENDLTVLAGRLVEGCETPPEGTELLLNYHHHNRWWVRDPEGRVVLICEQGV